MVKPASKVKSKKKPLRVDVTVDAPPELVKAIADAFRNYTVKIDNRGEPVDLSSMNDMAVIFDCVCQLDGVDRRDPNKSLASLAAFWKDPRGFLEKNLKNFSVLPTKLIN